MTKKEAKSLVEKYEMEPFRHYITNELMFFTVTSPDPIPELDTLFESDDKSNVIVMRYPPMLNDGYDYRVYIPDGWYNLYGWVD